MMTNKTYILFILMISFNGCYAQNAADTIKKNAADTIKGTILPEVTVDVENVKREKDYLLYTPTRSQRKFSNNSLDLLNNLDIPLLMLEKETGKGSIMGQAVTFYIDGREATADELKNLRAKDISNVEYHDMPKGHYAKDLISVNFVTKKYVSGGYVQPMLLQTTEYESGNYSLSSKFFSKKNTYIFQCGTGYAKDSQDKNETEETYSLDGNNSVTRQNNLLENKMKTNSSYIQFSNQHTWGKGLLVGRYTFVKNKSPYNFSQRELYYASGTSTKAETENNSDANYMDVYLFGRKLLTDNSQIETTLTASYTHSSYNNIYKEPSLLSTANADEKMYGLFGLISYTKSVWNGTLNLILRENFNNSTANYGGTYSSKRHYWFSETDILSSYNKNFGKHFNLSLAAQHYYLHFYGHTVNRVWYLPRGYIQIQYRNNKSAFTWGNYALTGNAPLMELCNTYVSLDGITDKQGNTELTIPRQWFSILSYNYNTNIYSFQAFAKYSYLHNDPRTSYTPTGNKLNSMTVSDVNHQDLIVSLGNIFKPHKNIKLNASVIWRTSKLTNGMHEHISYLTAFFSTQFYLKNLSIYSYIRSGEKTIMQSGKYYYYTPFSYGVEAIYGGNNLKVTLAVQNLFHKEYSEQSLNMKYYSYKRTRSMDNISNVITLRVSYSFDFGLKIQKEMPTVNTTINDSLMK